MSTGDRYARLARSPVGGRVTGALGLPRPPRLRRYHPGQPLLDGPALVLAADGGRLAADAAEAARAGGAEVHRDDDGTTRYAAVVLDATGVADVEGLVALPELLSDVLRRLLPSGRVVLLGRPYDGESDPQRAAARRALDGFVRSLGKELRAGATANLLLVDERAGGALASPLTFLLSARSAYVDGQVLRVDPAVAVGDAAAQAPADRPLTGRRALVTGAARGIGAAIAEVLARDGADLVCLDVPTQGEALAAVANRLGGSALQLDITADDAPDRLAGSLRERYGGVDVVVHNAGITRDRLLANMTTDQWSAVLRVNLAAQLRLTGALLDTATLRDGGRVVCISSTSGIAGNRGQTNYAASKAGIIGLVAALAPAVADRGITVNAVAPGFIETEMTAAMPLGPREVGRRINSLNQGGLPVDVAEAVAWLAEPSAAGVSGQVLRVCGQSMLGA